MKLSLKKFHVSGKTLARLWFDHARLFFMLLFFAVFGAGVYFWYDNVYQGRWTEEERQQYMSAAFKETAFKEGDFTKAVETASKRRMLHEENIRMTHDFFLPVPGLEKQP